MINGARYAMKLYRSQNDRHVRTFYPMFLGPTADGGGDGDGGGSSDARLRIIAAVINPEGHDPGSESVTIINTGRTDQSIGDWRIVDKNNRSMRLPSDTLRAGDTLRIVLDPSGPQLSNKGGRIDLLDAQNNRVHGVTYSKGQARTDGVTVVF